jgi:hypothetical protein
VGGFGLLAESPVECRWRLKLELLVDLWREELGPSLAQRDGLPGARVGDPRRHGRAAHPEAEQGWRLADRKSAGRLLIIPLDSGQRLKASIVSSSD